MKLSCLISAGPTREFFDLARFISSPSSGKMGLALAEAAVQRGWETHLIVGPTQLKSPQGLASKTDIVSAEELLEVAMKHFPACKLCLMAAAVCDMRPKFRHSGKYPKAALNLTPTLSYTHDILKSLAKIRKEPQRLLGFAAEAASDGRTAAWKKLREKGLDGMVVNSILPKNSTFESDTIEGSLLLKDGRQLDFPHKKKIDFAKELLKELEKSLWDAATLP